MNDMGGSPRGSGERGGGGGSGGRDGGGGGGRDARFTRIKGFQGCLLGSLNGATTDWCLPTSAPSNCDPAAWTQLSTGDGGKPMVVACPLYVPLGDGTVNVPLYLAVPGYDSCAQPVADGPNTDYCLPREKPAGCDPAAWYILRKGVSGNAPPMLPKCRTDSGSQRGGSGSSRGSGSSSGSGSRGGGCSSGPVSNPLYYLLVPDFSKCVEAKSDGGDVTEYCMKSSKPRECPEDSWKLLSGLVQCCSSSSSSS